MTSAANKEIVRSIRGSAGRFLAIVVISLLGAGFYAGLRMAAPDMRLTGDEFFDATNTYDISVVSTMGLDDESLEIIESAEGVGDVMPAYHADALASTNGASYVIAVESLSPAAAGSQSPDGVHVLSDAANYLNRLVLVQGAWPASDHECVVGVGAAELGVSLGDSIHVEQVEGDLEDTFAQSDFTVSGFVLSPLFISESQMGTTRLGSGEVEMCLFVDERAFADDLPYSVAYLGVPAARDAVWDTAAYDEALGAVKARVEGIAGALGDARYDAVKEQARAQLLGRIQETTASLGWTDELARPDVHVLDRSKNAGAASLSSDADGITQIASFLPFMFFLVAALVSLTSMTRMVDEERLEIGTHKALGYGHGRIISKYLVYGALASGAGAAVGVVALGKLLPWFILTSYAVTYDVPVFSVPLDPVVSAKAFGLSLGVTSLATWASAAASLRERPAALMLPRPPKAGKRIVLERIRPIWRRMSFSQKVTARNLLRYKRRFFMAVAGVAGCTALLMVGFGLRDAIGGIVANQYGEIVSYDMAVRVEDDITAEDAEEVNGLLASSSVAEHLAVDDFNMIAQGPDGDIRIEVVVPSDVELLDEFVTLRDRVSGQPLDLGGGAVMLTEKAAVELGAQAGDSITLFDENDVADKEGDGRSFELGGIVENYLGHFAYLTPAAYESAFDEAPDYSLTYVKLADGADAPALADALLAIDGVSTVSFVADKVAAYEDMLAVMDKLIVVIVLLSAALAFVVLYNLININIAERVREIATLKVLGFTRGEVGTYIFREVIVMALFGALVGCVAGVPLTFYIAEAAETANMMFGRVIEPASFVVSFLITMAFAVAIALLMRGKLARVDMVESLKSVD